MSDIEEIQFTDIVDVSHYVDLSIGRMKVSPLSLAEIGGLVVRFPELASITEGQKLKAGAVIAIADIAPRAIPTIIATAAGKPGAKGIEIAKRLSNIDEAKVLKKVFEITMPNGISVFVTDLVELGILSANNGPAQTAETDPDVIEL